MQELFLAREKVAETEGKNRGPANKKRVEAFPSRASPIPNDLYILRVVRNPLSSPKGRDRSSGPAAVQPPAAVIGSWGAPRTLLLLDRVPLRSSFGSSAQTRRQRGIDYADGGAIGGRTVCGRA